MAENATLESDANGTDVNQSIDPDVMNQILNGSPDDDNADESGSGTEGTPEHTPSSPGEGSESTPRSLAELNELADSSNFKMSDAERKRINVAMQKGFKSDEEIDAYLSEKSEGKDNSAKSEDETKKPDDSNKTDEDDDETKKETNKQDEDADDDGDIDSKLLKVIAPHLEAAESVDDAVKAIKNLQHHASRQSEFVNKVKELGFESHEDVKGAVDTLNKMDATLKQHLSTPEGLTSLYKAYGVEIPAGIGQASQPENAKPDLGTNTDQVNLDGILQDFEDDGFVDAKKFKSVIPALVKTIQEQVEVKYSEQNQTVQKMGQFVNALTQQTERKNQINQVFQDAREISESIGRFKADIKLNTDPSIIWKESVTNDGKFKKSHHPEFEKLRSILKVRNGAVKEIQTSNQRLGLKNGPVDVLAYLSKELVSSGNLSKLQTDAAKASKQNLASNLARKLQPNIRDKKVSKNDGFKIPKSPKDVDNMSRRQKKILLQKIRRGEIQDYAG